MHRSSSYFFKKMEGVFSFVCGLHLKFNQIKDENICFYLVGLRQNPFKFVDTHLCFYVQLYCNPYGDFVHFLLTYVHLNL